MAQQDNRTENEIIDDVVRESEKLAQNQEHDVDDCPIVFKTGDQSFLHSQVISYYSLQKARIAQGNRLVAHFKIRLGIDIQQPNEGQDEDADRYIDHLKDEWDRLADGFVLGSRLRPRLKPQGLFQNKAEVMMMKHYISMLHDEADMLKTFEETLEEFEVYNTFLKNVKGCGTLLAASCLAYFNPYKAPTASQFIAYAGLDVVKVERDGVMVSEGRSKRSEHLVPRTIKLTDGTEKTFQCLSYNPFLKTKLVGVLSASFLKMTNRKAPKDASIEQKYEGNKYGLMYHQYKHRIDNMPAHIEKTKAHRVRMGLRYITKKFIEDLWTAWRIAEGLPVCRSYAEEKLGIVHGHGEGDRRWVD